MREIIRKLDEFVCNYYENVKLLSTLPGYVMPSAIEVAESSEGPVGRLMLKNQPNTAEVLKSLKRLSSDVDAGFGYSIPLKAERARDFFHKKQSAAYLIRKLLKKYPAQQDLHTLLDMPELAFKKILKGEFYPTKRTCLRLCVLLGTTAAEYASLVNAIAKEFDRENLWEVVGVFVLAAEIKDTEVAKACFAEYGFTLLCGNEEGKNEFFDE